MKELNDRAYYIISIATILFLVGNFFLGAPRLSARGEVKVGILVQKEFERNDVIIKNLENMINKIRDENKKLLIKVLREKNIVLGKRETCDMDTKTGTLIFKETP